MSTGVSWFQAMLYPAAGIIGVCLLIILADRVRATRRK